MTASNHDPTHEPERALRTDYAAAMAAIVIATGGDVTLAETAVDDAAAELSRRWSGDGPAVTTAWLTRTARDKAAAVVRRMHDGEPDGATDEVLRALEELDPAQTCGADLLALILACCHPRLPVPAQVALVLRLVWGMAPQEIADVFLVPPDTMHQRLARAKTPFERGLITVQVPAPQDLRYRVDAAMAVLYVLFNEGYVGARSTWRALGDLSLMAIELARALLALLPQDDDLRGLLAYMLFIQARRPARVGRSGELVALPEQDRSRWDRSMIAEAQFLLRQAKRSRRTSRYTLEAAIQSEHAATLDGSPPRWTRILAGYDALRALAPSTALELNRAVAVAAISGPAEALGLVDRLPSDSHLWHAVRADLLTRLGRTREAELTWQRSMEFSDSVVEQAYMSPHSARDRPTCDTPGSPYREGMPATPKYTVPGLNLEDGQKLATILQDRLNALNDLMLTLKHVHWNVVGPHFIAVHEMIDPHVVEVREMVDETAERIATLGAAPKGTPSAIVDGRTWSDYSLGRATTIEHLKALDEVYVGLLDDHRKAQGETADLDPVTEDMLIGQIKTMELFHWFVRAHLENQGGQLD